MREIPPKGQRRIELASAGQAQQEHIRIRRSLADLPLPAKQMNVISVVCLYTLLGLSDRDIAEAVNVSIERVESIKMLDAYTEVYGHVVKSIIDEEAGDVRQLFAANARNAASTLIGISQYADNETVKLKAVESILDRAGHRPADVVEVRGRLDSTLQVVYVEADSEVVTIDGEAVQVGEE